MPETLGLYLQIPFCASKCSFCNFSSRVAPASVYDRYVQNLEIEMALLPQFIGAEGTDFLSLPVDTVYLGGGTPSLLGACRLQRLFEHIRRRFSFSGKLEATIEITPGSADEPLLNSLVALGMNRLSVGAQSFDDRELRSVGRLHSASDIRDQVAAARRAGFENINLDLLAGLPFQSSASWQNTLEEAIDLAPEHVSVYLFEVDERSRLGGEIMRGGRAYCAGAVPDDDFMAAAYELARQALAGAGYVQYEISNFARPGFKSAHNCKYWQMKPYLGLGAGAHSFDGVRRWSNLIEVEAYQRKLERAESPLAGRQILSATERAEEFFFLGLRQRQGVRLDHAQRVLAGVSLRYWEEKLQQLSTEGWLVERDGWYSLSDPALVVSNEIFQQFLT
ncbi:MAG: radical SAM family heme chaperone HemW [Terriglobia bacterium]